MKEREEIEWMVKIAMKDAIHKNEGGKEYVEKLINVINYLITWNKN